MKLRMELEKRSYDIIIKRGSLKRAKMLGDLRRKVLVVSDRGVPARYVSGYTHAPSVRQVASHAWAEAWLRNRWVAFDISHAREPGSAHIKLAIGLDYRDACPVRGVRLGGGDEKMESVVRVMDTRAHENQ